ncbi:ECF-type sigma factor [Singulisphaera sp. Ch08]|uniref:ECF-type sigma factor n=1 Tax=Singulisphaera sp. Ch08 TaxID=3120278 RepID=A0AAU7CLS7_9BACT
MPRLSSANASANSITHCIGMLKRGDHGAAERLWTTYIQRLVGLARAKIGGAPRGAADEEDVALSAFDSFCRRAEQGQFARLSDRDDLWQVLVVITERKAINLMRREGRKSRGEGKVLSFSDGSGAASHEAYDPGPGPEFAAQAAEEFRRLLGLLGDDSLREVALWKMEGYTNKQIAERLGCIEQTVERKLRSIRLIWTGGTTL